MAYYKKFDFKGIKRIEIPKTDDDFKSPDFGSRVIEKYLPSILREHQKNADKIDYLYKFYLGEQDILEKTRLYRKDDDNNNITVENHAMRQVDFNVGFISGEQRDYTHKIDSSSKDLTYLDAYFTDCNFFAKDRELKMWVFATGIGATHCSPRTDIIVSDGIDPITKLEIVRYANKSEGFDINTNAPFKFNCIDPRENFVVYSSGFDKEPLFCVSIVDIDVSNDDDSTPEIHKQIYIETRYASFLVESDSKYSVFYPYNGQNVRLKTSKSLHYLPIIEHSTNISRIGIVETNRDLFNQINTLKSSMADMIVDGANAILVFKNTDIDAEQVQEMKKAGAIVIKDSMTSKQTSTADVDTIRVEMPVAALNTYYEQLITPAYDISGTPLASGQISSGGSTGQALYTGAGWNNATIVANNNIIAFRAKDYELLKLILMFCRQVPNCPISNLQASQVDIKYRINLSNDFMTKAEGIALLYNINMPKDEILKASNLFNDVPVVSKKWEELDEKNKQLANQKVSFNSIYTKTNGNNSQE